MPVTHEAMLQEVLDYLVRLPAHPMTRAMAVRVEAHLHDAKAQAAQQQSDLMLAALQGDREGVLSFTPVGLPTLLLKVGLEVAFVSSPAARHYGNSLDGQRVARRLFGELAEGISIPLKARAEGV